MGGHIGVMPDLRAIVRGSLQLVPDLYVRRNPCDDGSPLGPGDEISSSPDIVVLEEELDDPDGDLGEGSAAAHHPAPGETRTDGGQIYVRLRNRGCASASVEVLLYAAPAATLITPDDWRPVLQNSVEPPSAVMKIGPVPAGDTLFVSGPAEWGAEPFPKPTLQPPPLHQEMEAWPKGALRAYSYLAVFDPDGEAAPDPIRALPPGGRYFDWRQYREFLRGPGVAWRNVHPIAPGAGAKVVFFLTGTPDRSRELDLEVIQRLPAGAAVELHLPRALASALHQRQPGLALTEAAASAYLVLPRRRRTRFGRIRLPRGLRAPAGFIVTTEPGQGLAEGHSLALRQLWRGEEVGRITWYVTQGAP